MRKHVEESVATGVAAGRGRGGRFSAGRKREVVLRLLRGEDLESVSRAVGITAARASHWRAQFLAAGQAGLKSRAPDARDEDHRRLQAKIGELLMETELLYAKVDQLEALWPGGGRRDEWRPVDLHPSGVWRAAGLPRVAPRPLQCVCAAAGDTVPCAVSSPRADRRCPGRRPSRARQIRSTRTAARSASSAHHLRRHHPSALNQHRKEVRLLPGRPIPPALDLHRLDRTARPTAAPAPACCTRASSALRTRS